MMLVWGPVIEAELTKPAQFSWHGFGSAGPAQGFDPPVPFGVSFSLQMHMEAFPQDTFYGGDAGPAALQIFWTSQLSSAQVAWSKR